MEDFAQKNGFKDAAELLRYAQVGLAACCCEKITLLMGGNVYDDAGGIIDSFENEGATVKSLSGSVFEGDTVQAALLGMYNAEFTDER